MKYFSKLILVLLIAVLTSSVSNAKTYEKGKVYNGFKLLEKRFVKEVNAECLYFEHVKSGARLFKIAAKDPNKTFSIAFKTDPESDSGTPHILEHSTLNGSKKFPVKSPFDILYKGSLNTFMNAFTGDDFTCYPFASMNNKDYFNLMNVYLDAVFNPRIYDEPRILMQEGWHYEMEKVEGPLSYGGIVYNEMKGAYSDPARELGYQIAKNLFPDNGYRFTSGGYPTAIAGLTPEMFRNYHKKYYHPVNSHILIYGDENLDKELAFIDKEYLSKFDKAERPATFPIQKPFTGMKEVTAYYPVPEGSKTEDLTYLSLNMVVGLNSDRANVMALNVLCDVLVNQESAPVRLALQKAGIGKDVSASVDDKQQPVFEIRVQNANRTDKDKFYEIVMSTLRDAAKNGLDKKSLEATISRTEFSLREGSDAQKGLTCVFQTLPGWLFANDPFITLEYEKSLTKLKTALSSNSLEFIIENSLIKNNHTLYMIFEPKAGLETEINANVKKGLDDYYAKLSNDAKTKIVSTTTDLVEYQKREDTPEQLATIPMLSRKDINPKASWYQVKEKKIANVPTLHYEDFSNNIYYSRLLFDMRVLPQELIQYVPLLAEALASMNTQNYDFGELDKALKINTGSFSTFLNYYSVNQNNDSILPKFVVDTKSLSSKVGKMFDLTAEILLRTKFNDPERLKTIITRHQARFDSQIKQNGYAYAGTRLVSYFSKPGLFVELTRGFEYYWFISDLAKNIDSKINVIIDNLVKTANLLFNKNNAIIAVTCSKNDYPQYAKEIEKLLNAFPKTNVALKEWNLIPEKKNEGFLTSSKVQYVLQGFDFKKLGYQWNGKMIVLNQVLSSDWLNSRIRIIGGAYGGFSSMSRDGSVLFSSYRDPNLKETLDTYAAIPEYLDKLEISDKEMTRYLIGTISTIDVPLTTQGKGNTAVRYFIEKTKRETVQKERDEVLSTTLKDIKSMSKMMKDVLNQKVICVYGNEEKLKAQKDLFKNIEPLSK